MTNHKVILLIPIIIILSIPVLADQKINMLWDTAKDAKNNSEKYTQITENVQTEITTNGTMTIKKWKDTEIKIQLPNEITKEKEKYAEKNESNIKIVHQDTEINWYPILIDNQTQGMEYEIVFLKQPKSNTVTFPISTENLSFYYQPPLDEQYNNHTSCNATECWNPIDDKLTIHRPENIVGSYAVYHTSKRDNQYETGKAFHIYRPFLTDADGIKTWANLTIINDTILITIPQKYLDNAKYPITLDPSFGYTTAGGSYAEHGGPAVRILVDYSPATNGNVTDINIYFGGATTSSKVRPVLYMSNYSLVTYGSEMAVATNKWVGKTVTSTAVTAGINYGPGFYYSNTQDFAYDSGTKTLKRSSVAYNDTLPPPNPFSYTSQITSSFYSVYANYTEAATSTVNICVCPAINTNWNYNLSDNCYLNADCDLGTGNLSFFNTSGPPGGMHINGTRLNVSKISHQNFKRGFTIWFKPAAFLH